MWSLTFCAFSFGIFLSIEGANYKMEHEAVKIVSYNKEYVINPKALLFQYNDTWQAYNMTISFSKAPTLDLKIALQTYMYQAKDYRTIPLQYGGKVCDMFRRNDFGVRGIYEYSNFRGCPLQTNLIYYIANYMFDSRKFPQGALIPGRFKVVMTIFEKNITFMISEFYTKIVPVKH